VAAVQTLFLERGYANTTIDAITVQEGVAASTVYAIFGSKCSFLHAIWEAWHERSHIRVEAFSNPGNVSPEKHLEQLAQATCKQWKTG
jgi:AcrR family transcriptional regulator